MRFDRRFTLGTLFGGGAMLGGASLNPVAAAAPQPAPDWARGIENQRKADNERLATDRFNHLKEKGERAAEIAAKDAERDLKIVEGAVESARSNVEAVKQNAAAIADATAAGREPGNPTLSGTSVSTGPAEREASEMAGAPAAGEETAGKSHNKKHANT